MDFRAARRAGASGRGVRGGRRVSNPPEGVGPRPPRLTLGAPLVYKTMLRMILTFVTSRPQPQPT